jgi:hypothetical protein
MIDARALVLREPSEPARRAAAALGREVSDLRVTWNPRMGTAKLVFSDVGYLTGSSREAAERVARAWLARHRDLFGLSASAVSTLKTTRDATLPGTGMHALVFRVMYGAIPTFAGGTLGVNVAADGRILTVWADTGPTGTLSARPAISAADALRAVARREGVSVRVRSLGTSPRPDRLTIFEAGGLFLPHNARLVAFPTASGPRLAWRVYFAKAGEEMLSTAVDARTGAVLFRHNQVAEAEGKVYRNYPGAPLGGQPEIVSFDGDPAASPQGWVGDLPTTVGNNIFAFADWTYPKLAPRGVALLRSQANPGPDYAPVSLTQQFNYDFTNEWSKACAPIILPDGSQRANPSFVGDRDPSVTNIFYLGNTIHDLAYKLGFTEKMGNFQQDNLGNGGKAQDAVRFMAMAGASNNRINNAFMSTPADGGEPLSFVDPANPTKIAQYLPPYSGMYLWRSSPGVEFPCADGDQDASIAWHEYTHGITNRVVGGPDDADALNAAQSGSMGEAWSDWFAMHFLFSLGLETRAAEGIYATGNAVTGIRHFALDDNPLTYGDFGFGRFGPEVHDDGEIWSAALWDLRSALVKRYGVKPGGDLAGHLAFDALALGPRLPSFLDQRDAILKADTVRNGGKDKELIWSIFARRGMGVSAKAKDASDVHPKPGFDVPGSGNGILTGVITDVDGGMLVGARIHVGLADGAPAPAAVSAAGGRYSLSLAPGSYQITVSGPGYGVQRRGKVTIGSGTTTLDVTLQKNLAAFGYGGEVTSGLTITTPGPLPISEATTAPDPGIALIDDHEFSGQIVKVGTPVVIKLAGTAPALVRGVSVAQRPAGASLLRAATEYTLELSVDGKTWHKVATGGVKKMKPRPRVTEFGRFTASLPAPQPARFVRFTVTKTLDPAQTTSVIGDLQVFGSSPAAKVRPNLVQPEFSEDGSISIANTGGGGTTNGSVTEQEFLKRCARPALQGIDAYIVELPDGFGDGVHEFATKGGDLDLDAYFWNAGCTVRTGQIATGSADEVGPIPPGTKWAVIILYDGENDSFSVHARSTLEPVLGRTGVLASKQTAPAPAPAPRQLPATGVGSLATLSVAALAGAAGLRRWLRKAA